MPDGEEGLWWSVGGGYAPEESLFALSLSSWRRSRRASLRVERHRGVRRGEMSEGTTSREQRAY